MICQAPPLLLIAGKIKNARRGDAQNDGATAKAELPIPVRLSSKPSKRMELLRMNGIPVIMNLAV